MAGKQNDFLDEIDRKAHNMWLLLTRLWDVSEGVRMAEGTITEIRIKKPRFDGDDTMVIVKAVADGRKFVAFHTSDSAPSALAGALSRLDNAQLKWKEDQWQQLPLPSGEDES